MKVLVRKVSKSVVNELKAEGLNSVLAKVLAGRGVTSLAQAKGEKSALLPYTALTNAEKAAKILADAILSKKRLLIVADYDADGATACSVGVRALKAFGANVGYLIPNRLEHGYGLTPEIAEIACNADPKPDYLITVDNGISSHAGIAKANSLGVPVIVTDHHLPSATPPDALVIVNPNQHGCAFPSKAMAGCGVIWYVMWALQDELLSRGYVDFEPSFDVSLLLSIVAIGTIADVVGLDLNNRILVNEGLSSIRKGISFPGIDALSRIAGRSPRTLATSDIAFGVGPRINAAGRLESMNAGVDCLTTNSVARAEALAQELHDINDRRKEIEGEMTEEAIRNLLTDVQPNRFTAVLHSDSWHKGVIGIVAGRLKEKIWRPTIILATGKDGHYTGSGRSIPGFHMRDALDLVDKRHPGLIQKFGGHAMAAGLTLTKGKLEEFSNAFEQVAKELLTASDLLQVLETDGSLDTSEMTLDTVTLLKNYVWGQNFPEPCFYDTFNIVESRPIGGGQHLRLLVEKDGVQFQGVKFRHTDGPPTGAVKLVYKLDANTFREQTNLQLLVENIQIV